MKHQTSTRLYNNNNNNRNRRGKRAQKSVYVELSRHGEGKRTSRHIKNRAAPPLEYMASGVTPRNTGNIIIKGFYCAIK